QHDRLESGGPRAESDGQGRVDEWDASARRRDHLDHPSVAQWRAGWVLEHQHSQIQGRPTATGVRRDKAALSSGCESHPANAPAGSSRSSYGGDEVAEAFG